MFFIVFLLFFSKYFPINSLRCMTNDRGTLTSVTKCTFDLNIDDPIPDDTQLTTTASRCAMHDADSVTLIGKSDGSCYAEVLIDYYTKKMTVKLTHVSTLQSMMSPYDDMFGFLNGIRSVVQYKIDGNLEHEKVQMITRIQCKTSDNCALTKLRQLLPNLIVSGIRWNIFKELTKFLNTRESSQESDLRCMNDDDSDVECSTDENRCKFDRSKTLPLSKGCIEDPDDEFDIAYRFNVIEEMTDLGTDNSAGSLKCFYLCKTDDCNSDDNFQKVDHLLTSFALASSSSPNTNSQNTTTKKPPAPQISRSDGVSFLISFYYQSIIMFSLFIQILSN